MAVQWDSEKGFNGVAVDVFDAIKNKILGIKKEVPEITDEIKEALDVIYDLNKNGDIDLSTLNSKGIKELTEDLGVSDDALNKFLEDWDGSGDIQEAFTARLQANTKGLTLFQRAGKVAGTAIKKFFATLGSMAAIWAISEGIQLVISGFSKLNDLIKENKHAIGNSISENYERASNDLDTFSNAISRTNEKINDLEGLRSKLDSAKNSEEDFYALSDDIYDATGYWVNGIKDISSAYETVTKKIDDTISKSKEYEKYLKSREHEELKNKLENSSVIAEDDDGNKTVYDFGGIENNPNTITDFDIQFTDRAYGYESITSVVDRYLARKQEKNKDIILSSQDIIDAYAKILNSSSDVADMLGYSKIIDISNEYGATPDTLPSEEDFKKSVTSTVEDYLEYYKDIISKSNFFSEDEFKEIITNALFSGDLTERNIDEFGKTLEKLSEVDSKDVDKQFNDLWDKYYSSSLDSQEEFKNEIINKYKEFLEKYGLNNDFLNNFLANLFFNSQRDSNKPGKGSKHKFSDFLESTDSDENSLNKKISEYKTKISEIAGYLDTLYDGNQTSDTLSEIAQKYGIVSDSIVLKELYLGLEKYQYPLDLDVPLVFFFSSSDLASPASH